jgi:hypothetical protein
MQGDPLSPLLFVLVMEALDRMISAAVSGGWLSSFSVGTRIDTSHLLFTNDALIFCWADPNHLGILQGLFLLFKVVLGLKTNLAKLELVLV